MTGTRRRDLLLLLGLLAAGLVLAAVVLGGRRAGSRAVVLVDNAEQAAFPLEEDTTYEILTPWGRNLLEIHDGAARLTEADCPDLLCVKQGAVRYAGDSIICLPHRVVVEIRGADKLGLDAVAK